GDRTGSCADAVCTHEQPSDLGWRARRLIFRPDAMATAIDDQVLAQELSGGRIEQAHVVLVPLDAHRATDPAWRWRVVRAVDLDEAVEVDRAISEGVVAKWLDGQRPKMRPLVGKHGGDLALGRAVDSRIG